MNILLRKSCNPSPEITIHLQAGSEEGMRNNDHKNTWEDLKTEDFDMGGFSGGRFLKWEDFRSGRIFGVEGFLGTGGPGVVKYIRAKNFCFRGLKNKFWVNLTIF